MLYNLIVWVMFVLDILLYSVLIAYIDKIAPGKYGVAEKWYFLLMPSYWCPRNRVAAVAEERAGDAVDDVSMFESDPKLTAGIKVNNLRKEFKKVYKTHTYPSYIFDLQRHSGARQFTQSTV